MPTENSVRVASIELADVLRACSRVVRRRLAPSLPLLPGLVPRLSASSLPPRPLIDLGLVDAVLVEAYPVARATPFAAFAMMSATARGCDT